jgi:uncharacterized tellurite resistance protein B-like protein
MLAKVGDFFKKHLSNKEASAQNDDQRTLLAAVILLLELAHADHQYDLSEEAALVRILQQNFFVSDSMLNELLELAAERRKEATSFYEFTRLINDNYSRPEKQHLLLCLWQIAFSDGRIDRYEEYTLRRLCELIHMSQSDFIRAKKAARELLKN